ncbi:hypothetical protein BYT27DRAFT_7073667, partial [Phlegmacium glaucopus]
LERMARKWTSPVYVFFKKTPQIQYKDGRHCHVFECAAGRCKGRNSHYICWFLDKGDANSTGNLLRHARICWGTEAVEAATATQDLNAACDVLAKTKLWDGSILTEFQHISKSKVTYRHTQHTTSEARAEIVRWSLMKTGRPGYHIPSPETVLCDVKTVFVNVHKCIAKMLQEYEGALSFATDAWTSPNHKAYVAVMVHFEKDGVPISMLLDIVEVTCSHSGLNLAAAF